MTNLPASICILYTPDILNKTFQIFGTDPDDDIWDAAGRNKTMEYRFVDELHLLLFCVTCV